MTAEERLAAIETWAARWLGRFALGSDDEDALVQGFCDGLVEQGLPLLRMAAATEIVHPVFDARAHIWRRGKAVERREIPRDAEDNEEWLTSPFRHMKETRTPEIRRRLGHSYQQGEFPVLDGFVREGATDYLALKLKFGVGATLGAIPGVLMSFTTDRAGGFAEG
jgi:adenylate cyclase